VASFQDQIESLVGSLPTSLSTSVVSQAMSDGMQDIVKKVETNRREDLWMFTVTEDVPAAGLAIDSGRIVDVERGGNPCKNIEVSLRHRASQSDSIDYATGEFPVFYNLGSKISILPTPGPAIPFLIDTSLRDDEGVDMLAGFATYSDGDRTLITSNAAHGFVTGDQVQISQSNTNVVANTHYSGMHYATNLSSTTFYIEKDFTAIPFSEDISSGAISGSYIVKKPLATCSFVDSFPASNCNVESDSLYACPSIFYPQITLWTSLHVINHRLDRFHDLLPNLVMPSLPISPSVTDITFTIPTYIPPTGYVLPSPPEGAEIDFSDVPVDQPIFSPPEPPVLPTIDLTDVLVIPEFSPGTEVPVVPDSPSFSDGLVDYTIVRQNAPEYIAPVFVPPEYPVDISTLDLSAGSTNVSTPGSPPPPPVFSDGESLQAFESVPEFITPAMDEIDFSYVVEQLEVEEDVELSAAKINEIQAKIAKHQGEVASASAKFNSDVATFNTQVDQVRKNKDVLLTKEGQEYQQNLSVYQQRLALYQQDVNSKLQEWTNNNITVKVGKWTTLYQQELGRYQQEIAISQNKFNEQLQVYTTEVQKAVADAQGGLSAESTEYQAKLNKYQQELGSYQAAIATATTNYQNSIVQQAITQFNVDRTNRLAQWQTDASNILAKYNADVSKSFQEYTADKEVWQMETADAIAEFTSQAGYDLQRYQAIVNSESAKFTNAIQLQTGNFTQDLARFSAHTAKIGQDNRQNFENYSSQLQAYNSEVGALTQKFTQETSQIVSEYDWLTKKYGMLRQQYIEGFTVVDAKRNEKE